MVVIVAVIVAVSQINSTPTDVHYTPRPVPATVLDEITHVPTSSYNTVGTGPSSLVPPAVEASEKLLTTHGKPEMFGFFGEFCPFCAAERWAIITTLSRFGTFRGLRTMQSSPIDSYPKTQTFEFNTATYTSPYLATKLIEVFGQEKATHSRPVINTPTKQELDLVKKLDPDATSTVPIPFTDWGNKVVFSGSSYTPSLLQGLSRATIAAGLKDPTNIITTFILGASNYMSAAICYIDGGKPGAVCASSGVQAAAKALKIKV